MHEHWPILVWVAYWGAHSNAVAQPDRTREESPKWRSYRPSACWSYQRGSHGKRAGTLILSTNKG